ncbi:DUF1772 domain-containing protein [Amycolatopsis keratiniphila]|uniref:DUF1772 domain-containing protein n=1 Tax=Amycolatopsis keratiniphila TaxID=129921 RepID=UPI00087A9F4C|nr:DUF1772 domain-containing protein [Amycolatopsis keratiniphila]OLZ58288.1 hypothetical protein BS330_11960 [Amycolatopsis keratiniphila subsp. nogabecina]SDU28955.1 Uncharacterized membrane protein [Amycolatopsis keratiniphila]
MSKIRWGLVTGVALLSTGLLAGAFGYGAVNVAATFDVRLTFHTALMQRNGVVMQTAMALAAISSLALALLSRGRPRLLAAVAAALVVTSFLVTRFGNVPINGRIKVWAVTTAPADHAAILDRWETYNVVRTVAALTAFALVIVVSRLKIPDRAPTR